MAEVKTVSKNKKELEKELQQTLIRFLGVNPGVSINSIYVHNNVVTNAGTGEKTSLISEVKVQLTIN